MTQDKAEFLAEVTRRALLPPPKVFTLDPADDSIAIGDNGHAYAATRLPGSGSGWATDAAYQILDCIAPGVIPVDVRMLLCGQIAGAMEVIAEAAPPKKKT